MSLPSVVRPATANDFVGIWKLLRLAHKEGGIFPESVKKVEWILDRVLHPEEIPPDDTLLRGFAGVIGPEGGELEGLILMAITAYWYTDDLHLEEFSTFVHPDHRKTKHAHALLNYSKRLSDMLEIPLLIGIVSNKRTESKIRLYRKHFAEVGSFFLYNARTGEIKNGRGK